jgi:hypothetical protein
MNPSLLDITVLMLDLKEQKRFDLAKQTLQSLEGDIQDVILGGKPLGLVTFKGVNAFKNAKQARLMYVDLEKDEAYNRLRDVSSYII